MEIGGTYHFIKGTVLWRIKYVSVTTIARGVCGRRELIGTVKSAFAGETVDARFVVSDTGGGLEGQRYNKQQEQ